MSKNKKIGWQKYEDYIEKQLSSPQLHHIIKTLIGNKFKDALEEHDDEEESLEKDTDIEEYDDLDENEQSLLDSSAMLPITPQLIEDISLMSNFDCWIGHTNFDITKSIKDRLDKVDGIEILKIWSRYRFFIGIGQMFNFKEVRNSIENILLKGDNS